MACIHSRQVKSGLTPFEVRQWRRALQFEQTDAARALGVSRRAFQDYETKGAPQRIMLAALGISIMDYIIKHPDAPAEVILCSIRNAVNELSLDSSATEIDV